MKEHKNSMAPFFPFNVEYCTIERALAAFDCKIEDLLDLAINSRIKFGFHLNADQRIKSDLAWISEEMNIALNTQKPELNSRKLLTAINNKLSEFSKLCVCHSRAENLETYNAYGIWGISYIEVTELKVNKLIHVTVLEDLIQDYEFEIMSSVSVKIEDLLIMKWDLERICLSIKTGLPLSYHYESIPNNTNKITRVHGNAIRFEKNRQEVLEFALYVLKNFPEKCKTSTQLAAMIDEKALLKWPETGEPPLARSTIEKYIASILKI
jgi:hypothetical protein